MECRDCKKEIKGTGKTGKCHLCSLFGKRAWNKGIKTGLVPKTAFKKGQHPSRKTEFTKEQVRGKNNCNWRGGITPLNFQIRNCTLYRQHIRQVLERDNFTCKLCGQIGGKLQVNHIKPFAVIIYENKIKSLEEAINCWELWDLNNLETLCFECHKKTDTYKVGTLRLIEKLNLQ